MDRLTNIVVGVDFSKYSQNALAQAIRIANWNEAKLHVVHVIEPTLTTSLADAYGVAGVNTWSGFREMARERTARMISIARKLSTPNGQTEPPEVQINVEILFGNPFVHMLRLVRDVDAKLLILGSNGTSPPSQGPGSLATRCIHKAPIKVMLVTEYCVEPFKRIVACVSFSDTCHQTIKQAIRIARQEKSALHVLHVYKQAQKSDGGDASLQEGPPKSQQEIESLLNTRLSEFLPPFASEMSGLQVEIRPTETHDDKDGIIEFVKSANADLVVLWTSGQPEFKAKPKETTAERIVRETFYSVLTIKPENFKYDIGGTTRK
jgi:nucleotide-binding universal stress UspA family protein